MPHRYGVLETKRYILLAELPLNVTFLHRAFVLRLEDIRMGGDTAELYESRLMLGLEDSCGGYRCTAQKTRAKLVVALYQTGFEVPSATVPETALERLIQEGRARRIRS